MYGIAMRNTSMHSCTIVFIVIDKVHYHNICFHNYDYPLNMF